jgi:hypothetical protein
MYIENNLFPYMILSPACTPHVILFAINLYTSHRVIQGDVYQKQSLRTMRGSGKAIELMLTISTATGNGPSFIHLGPGNTRRRRCRDVELGANQGATETDW